MLFQVGISQDCSYATVFVMKKALFLLWPRSYLYFGEVLERAAQGDDTVTISGHFQEQVDNALSSVVWSSYLLIITS